MHRPVIASVLVVALFAVSRPASADDADILVGQLGSPEFVTREDATLQLFKLGRAATSALRVGLKAEDPEIRRRCELLLPLAERSDQDIWLDHFVAGTPDAPPPTGWNALKAIVGDGVEGRMLCVELYRSQKDVLELLEKEPGKLASQALERCRRLQQRTATRGKQTDDIPPGEVAAALLAAASASNNDPQIFNQFNSLFYQPALRTAVQRTPGASRLIGRILSQRGSDINQLSQTVYLAKNMGLLDYIEDHLKPALRKFAESVQPGDNQGRFTQLVYLARTLELDDLIREKLEPGVRKMAEDAVANPTDAYKFQQAVSMAQQLKMEATLETVLKPAGLKLIQAAAEKPEELNNRFWQLQYISRTLGLSDAVDVLLKPVACRYLAELTLQSNDLSKFYQAQNLARTLQLQEAIEGVLQPATRKMILTSLEQSSGDVNRITQAIAMARGMDLGDLVEDTLKPWVRRQAQSLKGEGEELTRLTQLHSAAQTLGLQDVINDDLKPIFAKVVQSAVDQPLNNNTVAQTLNLARSLNVKEAAPLALKAAMTRSVPSYTRGQAIFFVADFGEKEDVASLESLLDDATNVGSTGINWTTIHAEIRDVALAVLVQSSGQSLADYGFPYFQTFPAVKLTTTWPGSVGFAGAEGRTAALKKWKDWSAAQKK